MNLVRKHSTKVFLKPKRPVWNSSVNAAHRRSKAALKQWKASAKPNSPTNPARELHLKVKRKFRKALRAWKHEKDFLFYSIWTWITIQTKYFVNLALSPIWLTTLRSITSGNKVLEGWATHFESYGQPSSHNYDYAIWSIWESHPSPPLGSR